MNKRIMLLSTLLFLPRVYAGESVRIGPAVQNVLVSRIGTAKRNKQMERLCIGKFVCENKAELVLRKCEPVIVKYSDRIAIGFDSPFSGSITTVSFRYLTIDEVRVLGQVLTLFLDKDYDIRKQGELQLKFIFGLLGPRGEDDGVPLSVKSIQKCLDGVSGQKRLQLTVEDLVSIAQTSKSIHSFSNYLLIS